MGNNQSQVPDDEGVPRYSYHESVLRDAQTHFISSDTRPRDHVINDEQYFSAEESGSVSSLTPERTRPESSSGEDSSDNSEGSIIEGSNRNEPCEGHNSTHAVDLRVPVAPATSTNSSQANVRVLQSLNQDNDCVGLGLENVRESSASRFTDSACNSRSDIGRCLTNKDVTTPQLSGMEMTKVPDPCGLILNDTSVLNKEPIPNLGKRKLSPNSERESVLPIKRMLTRSSYKRKRLKYSDSSESEKDKKEGRWKPNKKEKIILHSSKKAIRVDRHSRERDSDENRYGKQRHITKTRCSYDSESTESDDETEDNINFSKYNRRRNKTSKNPGGERKYNSEKGKEEISKLQKRQRFKRRQTEETEDSDISDKISTRKRQRSKRYQAEETEDSSDISGETSKYRKRYRSKRHQTEETDSEEKRDRVEARKTLRHVSSQTADINISEDTSSIQSQQKQVNLLVLENTQSMVKSKTLGSNVTSALLDADISNQPCHTFKMGDHSFRNTLGKVFPIRPPGQKDSASSSRFNTCRSNVPTVFGLKDIESNLKPSLSAENLDSSVSKVNKVWHAEKETLANLQVLINQSSPSGFRETVLDDCPPAQKNFHVSPFKNVTLTTPSTNNKMDSISQQPTILKLAVPSNCEEHCSDMEVDDAGVTMETQTATNQMFISRKKRDVHHCRHKDKTVAARFRHFWSEKKKNISQNLKLLFSKTNSSEKQHFNGPVWQTFSTPSSSSQNTPSVSRNSHGTHEESSVAFINGGELPGPSLSSITASQQGSERSGASLSTSQSVQAREHQSASMTSQPNISGSAPTQVFPKTGSKVQQSVLAVHNNVELLPCSLQYQVLNFRLAGVVEVSISIGDLDDQKTAGLVNWTDGALTHTVTSCSKSIAAKAGALMRAACNDYIESKGGNLEAPDVLTTPAGGRFERAVQAILHVVEPDLVNEDEECTSHALTEVFANCLRFASERLGLDSISFPLIGDGKFPSHVCVRSFFAAVLMFLAEQSNSCELSYIQLIIPDITAANFAADLVKSDLKHISESEAVNAHDQHRIPESVTCKTNPNMSESSQEKNFTVERAVSGRPRLKRPRL